jgi:dynein intermediate chain 1
MAIYSVKWNKFHPGVFLSCSADWTVKLWEVKTRKPIMIFDLNTSVGDVAWSPFSSTVFATITTDGRVRVYDLNVNKHEPIGEYRVQSRGPNKPKLTNICFNPVEPIICVGDDKGTVSILKLSANLRKMSASAIEEINQEDEIAKLDKVMIMPDSEEGEDIHTLLEAAAEGNTDIGGSPNTVAVSS